MIRTSVEFCPHSCDRKNSEIKSYSSLNTLPVRR